VIDTVQARSNRAFMPWFSNRLTRRKDDSDAPKKSISSFTSGLLIFYSVMYLCVGLFSQEFVLLFTSDKYSLAWLPIPILVAAYAVKSVYYMYMDVLLYYKDQSKKLFVATVTGSLLNIVISAFLAEPMGMYGIALSFLIAKVVVLVIAYFIARPHVDRWDTACGNC
jgi:O-antigen/teichoic acid export membrane protein